MENACGMLSIDYGSRSYGRPIDNIDLALSAKYGGSGMSYFSHVIAMEELSRASGTVDGGRRRGTVLIGEE